MSEPFRLTYATMYDPRIICTVLMMRLLPTSKPIWEKNMA